MSGEAFSCRRCGHCCLTLVDAYRGCVSDADLELWKRLGREDILKRIETLDLGRGNLLHTAWLDPETGDDVERCPWLAELPEGKGYSCSIESIKPEHCRNYPENRKHAEGTGCPAFMAPSTITPSKEKPDGFDSGET